MFIDTEEFQKAKSEFAHYRRALVEHATLEDSAVFSVLDSLKEGGIGIQAFMEEHIRDDQLGAAVAGSSNEELSSKFREYKAFVLEHLKHEEDAMMPLTVKTGATPRDRAAVFAKILTHKTSDFDFHLGWTVDKLSRLGSSQNDAVTATRVFCLGLKFASTKAEWPHFASVIKSHCAPDVWSRLEKENDISSVNGFIQ